MRLPFGKRGEQIYAEVVTESPSEEVQITERVVAPDNMVKAYKHAKRNGGSLEIDEMTVEELGPYLREHWPELREALLSGTYESQPVKRVNIPKPGGELWLQARTQRPSGTQMCTKASEKRVSVVRGCGFGEILRPSEPRQAHG